MHGVVVRASGSSMVLCQAYLLYQVLPTSYEESAITSSSP